MQNAMSLCQTAFFFLHWVRTQFKKKKTVWPASRRLSEMCTYARETYTPNGKHASLVIYVRGNTIPGETHITMTPDNPFNLRFYCCTTFTIYTDYEILIDIVIYIIIAILCIPLWRIHSYIRTYSYYLAMTSVMGAGICFNCND